MDEELVVEDEAELEEVDDEVPVVVDAVTDVVVLNVDVFEVLVVSTELVDATVPEVERVRVIGVADLKCTYTRPFDES